MIPDINIVDKKNDNPTNRSFCAALSNVRNSENSDIKARSINRQPNISIPGIMIPIILFWNTSCVINKTNNPMAIGLAITAEDIQ